MNFPIFCALIRLWGVVRPFSSKRRRVEVALGRQPVRVGSSNLGFDLSQGSAKSWAFLLPEIMIKSLATLCMCLFLQGVSAAGVDGLPDARLTPGATNPNVTPQNIRETICVRGYSKSIRPPESYTNHLKRKQIKLYGYTDRNPSHYEEDHLISLELGGSPTSPKNLWPEPRRIEWGAKKKDRLENALHRAVCNDEISLTQAQHEIATGWVGAYRKYVGE